MAELTVIEREPISASVIAYLEKLLGEARNGELSAIAVTKVYRDGTTGSGWSDLPALATMVGAVAILQVKLVEMAREV